MAEKKKTRISTAKVLREIVLPRKWLLLLGLLLILIRSGATLVIPRATKILIDDVIPNGDMDMLKLVVIVSISAITLQASTSFALTRLLSVQAQALIAKLRVQVTP